jgi:hypothetical protein
MERLAIALSILSGAIGIRSISSSIDFQTITCIQIDHPYKLPLADCYHHQTKKAPHSQITRPYMFFLSKALLDLDQTSNLPYASYI